MLVSCVSIRDVCTPFSFGANECTHEKINIYSFVETTYIYIRADTYYNTF